MRATWLQATVAGSQWSGIAMASLNFDEEKQRFRDYFEESHGLFNRAVTAYRVLLTHWRSGRAASSASKASVAERRSTNALRPSADTFQYPGPSPAYGRNSHPFSTRRK